MYFVISIKSISNLVCLSVDPLTDLNCNYLFRVEIQKKIFLKTSSKVDRKFVDVRKEKENETFLLSMRRFLCREALTFPFRCDCEIIFVISIVIEPRRAYQSRKRLGNTTGARYLRSTCSVITRATRPGNDCNYACVSVSHRGYEHACTCVHTR